MDPRPGDCVIGRRYSRCHPESQGEEKYWTRNAEDSPSWGGCGRNLTRRWTTILGLAVPGPVRLYNKIDKLHLLMVALQRPLVETAAAVSFSRTAWGGYKGRRLRKVKPQKTPGEKEDDVGYPRVGGKSYPSLNDDSGTNFQ